MRHKKTTSRLWDDERVSTRSTSWANPTAVYVGSLSSYPFRVRAKLSRGKVLGKTGVKPPPGGRTKILPRFGGCFGQTDFSSRLKWGKWGYQLSRSSLCSAVRRRIIFFWWLLESVKWFGAHGGHLKNSQPYWNRILDFYTQKNGIFTFSHRRKVASICHCVFIGNFVSKKCCPWFLLHRGIGPSQQLGHRRRPCPPQDHQFWETQYFVWEKWPKMGPKNEIFQKWSKLKICVPYVTRVLTRCEKGGFDPYFPRKFRSHKTGIWYAGCI